VSICAKKFHCPLIIGRLANIIEEKPKKIRQAMRKIIEITNI